MNQLYHQINIVVDHSFSFFIVSHVENMLHLSILLLHFDYQYINYLKSLELNMKNWLSKYRRTEKTEGNIKAIQS